MSVFYLENPSIKELDEISRRIRLKLVQLSHQAQTAHLASSLSCVDILTVLYWGVLNVDPSEPKADGRDRFILSKGHAATSLYTTLAYKGFMSEEVLNTFASDGSLLAEHPGVDCIDGVELATGALGHGLSVGAGMALSAKLKNLLHHVYVLVSDGECNEGSLWEGAMFAATHNLSNLTAIVDFNKWQATGRSKEVMKLEPFADKWRAFGWNTIECDGHNLEELKESFSKSQSTTSQPTVVIAHTVKGKGISFMEDDNNWHYRAPTKEEVELSRVELGLSE